MFKNAHPCIAFIAICTLILMFTPVSASAQGIEIVETSEAAMHETDEWTEDKGEEKKLSEECKEATASYIEARETMGGWLMDLENVVLINQLMNLKEDLDEREEVPEECGVEIEKTIEDLITKSFDVKPDSVDWEKVRIAASSMKKQLFPIYKIISEFSDDVCKECSFRPPKLKDDPIECNRSILQYRTSKEETSCKAALKKYVKEKDMLIYKSDLCGQRRKLERLDKILFWFQGRDDIPLVCAVEIKGFIDELKDKQNELQVLGFSLIMMDTMCSKGLFTAYRRFGNAATEACRVCDVDNPMLEKDGIDCF